MTGLRYRNYTNYLGTQADGTCCDNSGLTSPNCSPDQCDTSFLPCATYVGGTPCDAYFKDPTPTMVDQNEFVLQTQIGNTPGTAASNVKVFLSSFSPAGINFEILAQEVTHNSKALIAEFSFAINWMDTFYHPTDHWRPLVLKDTHAELGIDVLHQCFLFWHGPTCSVYCRQTHQYTCLPDGSKNCTKGWQGPNCNNVALTISTSTPPTSTVTTSTQPTSTLTTSTQRLNTFRSSRAQRSLTRRPLLVLHILTSTPNNLFSTSNMPTIMPGLGLASLNLSSNQQSISNATHTSSNRDEIAIVAICVPVALFVTGVVLTSLLYYFNRMKKMRARQSVQPSPSPSVCDKGYEKP
ncbi:hypothetical protein RRG08_016413 [Elysia crispata]|uniref:Delta-like protein n=1 Tax=Elysia crispata TaxID=231223 RepID=A0AAE1CUJ5_9GAST|nr:hypothetical protein RRG08_016413 [Elysia crispata]